MYQITFPEGRAYSGVYLSVAFVNGVGQTDSDYLARRFQKKGLQVEKVPPKKASKAVLEDSGQ